MIVLRQDIDILIELKKKGYPQYRLRKEKILCENAIQKLRNKEMISLKVLDILCEILECQPGDLIGYIKK